MKTITCETEVYTLVRVKVPNDSTDEQVFELCEKAVNDIVWGAKSKKATKKVIIGEPKLVTWYLTWGNK